MKPLRQGEMDSLCGLYAVVNALRLCSGGKLSQTHAQAVFRHMVKAVAPSLARLACSGSTDDDVKRYLRVALLFLEERYGIGLKFRYRTCASYERLKAVVEEHLAEPDRAVVVSADRHLTVISAVHGDVWELQDSWGYKYLHCIKGKVSRQKPMLRTMPELEVFLILPASVR